MSTLAIDFSWCTHRKNNENPVAKTNRNIKTKNEENKKYNLPLFFSYTFFSLLKAVIMKKQVPFNSLLIMHCRDLF